MSPLCAVPLRRPSPAARPAATAGRVPRRPALQLPGPPRGRDERVVWRRASCIPATATGGGEVERCTEVPGTMDDSTNLHNKDPRSKGIYAAIRGIPDFPKPGILFHDVTTLMLNHKAFKDSIDMFVERYKDVQVDAILGFEARGFIFGPPIALALGCAFVPLRKPKKLPGETISEEYSLEYGTDKIEMHKDAVKAGQRVILIDDLIATGGTMSAGVRLMERVGAEIIECACVIEMPDLKGREKITKKLFCLIEKEGD